VSLRSQRKLEHLKHAIEIPPGPNSPGFNDLYLIHQALSPLDLVKINTETIFLGKKLNYPLVINAITGGAPGLEKINKKLALTAKECGIALAVGSQTAALENAALIKTFQIVREVNPQGIILANVGALTDYRLALEAVEMIEADGLQLHLNLAQELVMAEGDRKFKSLLENIRIIKEKVSVPVIIKEVGFGLAMETVQELENLDISYFDIGGTGGTNFIAIENARNSLEENDDLLAWGIPTVTSLIETLNCLHSGTVIASGGVYTPLDILKALVLGANLVGIASPFLKLAYFQDADSMITYTDNLMQKVKKLMLLIGAGDLEDLKTKPIVITGLTRQWLEVRGIDVKKYAMRGICKVASGR